jgi:hypothetical protein
MTTSVAITIAVGLVFLFRQFRQRAFRVERLWIVPVAIVLVVVLSVGRLDFGAVGIAAMLGGVALGVPLGLVRAHAMVAQIDVPGRRIVTKPNIWLIALFALLLIGKTLLRGSAPAGFHAATTFGLVLTAASVCAQRWRFYVLFRRAAAAEADAARSRIAAP